MMDLPSFKKWVQHNYFRKVDSTDTTRGAQDANRPLALGALGYLNAIVLNGIATLTGLFVDGVLRVRQSGSTRYRSDHAVTAGVTTVNSYDDTGAVYLPIVIDGSTISLRPSANAGKALIVAASGDVTVNGGLNTSAAITAGNAVQSTSANAGFILYNRATNLASIQFYSPTAGELRIYNHVAGGDRLTLSPTGDMTVIGTIKTTTGAAWDLKTYTAGAPAATGYVSVVINGVTYKLLAST